MARHGDIRIGISGWRYKPWRGVFYPGDLAQKNELAYAAKAFRTIEINGTFYSLQRPSSFAEWAAQTPQDFQFAVKGSRFITHNLRLKNTGKALANFFASGFLRLGPKLGPSFGNCRPRSNTMRISCPNSSQACRTPANRPRASRAAMMGA